MARRQRHHRASVAPVVVGRVDQEWGMSFRHRAKLLPAGWAARLATCRNMPEDTIRGLCCELVSGVYLARACL